MTNRSKSGLAVATMHYWSISPPRSIARRGAAGVRRSIAAWARRISLARVRM